MFETHGFMPHGHCYLWKTDLLALHVISDSLIALAYTSIPFTLLYFARKRRDLPFRWMFVCFGAFIIACGTTHAIEIWTLWEPDYWISGMVKAFTALVSILTAILLARAIPEALAIPSHQQLQEAKETSETMYRELESFSYMVAHDLRGPLRSIDGFSGILRQTHGDKLDEKGIRYLNKIQAASDRMARLIDDLLKLAKVSQGELGDEETDLCALARVTASEIETLHPDRSVEFRVACNSAIVRADSRLIKIALDNLIGNSWKFTKKREKAFVEFGVETRPEGRVFYVRDNGVGFDAKRKDRLFKAFERLHDPREFEGTGIGLATVHRIIERHHGKIWADSKVDHGTVFYFTLPEIK